MTINHNQLDLPYAETTKPKGRTKISDQYDSKYSTAGQSIDGILLLKSSGTAQGRRIESAHRKASSITAKAMNPSQHTNATRSSHKSDAAMTWPGFLYGCVLGGAAAAVALVLLDSTVL